jgi:hypothetical protein
MNKYMKKRIRLVINKNEHIRRVIELATNIKDKSALLDSKAESRVSNNPPTDK